MKNCKEKHVLKKQDSVRKETVLKVWQDPEMIVLTTESTAYFGPDVLDGGGPYS